MKILSITAQKPNSTGSGVYLTELVRSWQAQGHTQAIVAGFAQGEDAAQWEGARVYPVRYGGEALPFPVLGMSDEMPYPSTRYRDLTGEQLACFEREFHRQISRAIEQEQPDWIVCHHLYLLAALVRKWFPQHHVAGICHGSDLRQMIKNPRLTPQIAPQIASLDCIVALQQAQKDEICRLYGCEPSRIEVLGAGYNPAIFHSSGAGSRNPETRQLIFAGKVTEKKGIFSLFGALNRLNLPAHSLRVVIAGGPGPEAEFARIRKLAADCRYPVELTGILPQQELAQRFRESDVFVLPSFFEGLPLVTIEAMACGCRVVCTDLPGLQSWFADHVPGQQVLFVPLPPRTDADEVDSEVLPEFEKRLSLAILQALERKEPEAPDLTGVSWDGISRSMLRCFERSV